MTNGTSEFNPPFPALTPSQRYYLDVNGYVVIENALEDELVGRMLEAMLRLKRDLHAANEGNPEHNVPVRGCRFSARRSHYEHFGHILESDPAIFDYLTHPRMLGMVQELTGGTVRLEESEAAINDRDPEAGELGPGDYGFHTGTRPQFGTYTERDLYHCNFVKTLTNLTELGPDDGGTVVIAGSHKIQCEQKEIIACAVADPQLIHQVVAPAGSTLLFGEALIHATGHVRSDRERVIVIGGYTPPMFQAWPGQEPTAAFVETLEEPFKTIISGSAKWSWQRQFRDLQTPRSADF
jgi:hypothetical protein